MPVCPACKTEYVRGVATCHDCGVALVEALPPENASRVQCPGCSEWVAAESDFCVYCGSMLIEQEIRCETHPNTEADGVCVICHRLLCGECATVISGKALCDDHKGIEISEHWAVAFQSMDYYEANLVRAKLESAGVTVSPRNNSGIGFLVEGFAESTLGRIILKYPVKVFVPVSEYLEAFRIVNEPGEPLSNTAQEG